MSITIIILRNIKIENNVQSETFFSTHTFPYLSKLTYPVCCFEKIFAFNQVKKGYFQKSF